MVRLPEAGIHGPPTSAVPLNCVTILMPGVPSG